MKPIRIGIQGSGAIGSLVAGALALQSTSKRLPCEVYLIPQRHSRHMELVERKGITICDRTDSIPIQVTQIETTGSKIPPGSLWSFLHTPTRHSSVLSPVKSLWVGTDHVESKFHPPSLDVAILCVKGKQSRNEAIKKSLALLSNEEDQSSRRLLVCLMNGGGHYEAIKNEVSSNIDVVIGTTTTGARIEDDGAVSVTGWGSIVMVADDINEMKRANLDMKGPNEPNSTHPSLLDKFSDLLADALWPTSVVVLPASKRMDAVWRKLLINIVINTTTALLKVKNGALVHPLRELISEGQSHMSDNPSVSSSSSSSSSSSPSITPSTMPPFPWSSQSLSLSDHIPENTKSFVNVFMSCLINEFLMTAHSMGALLDIDRESALASVLKVAEGTSQNTSSMLVDVLQGRPTEAEYILGYVIETAEAKGIQTPTIKASLSAILSLPSYSSSTKKKENDSKLAGT